MANWAKCQNGFQQTEYNCLSMLTKPRLCFFHLVRKTVAYPKLYINNKEIEHVDSFMFLELQINHNVN